MVKLAHSQISRWMADTISLAKTALANGEPPFAAAVYNLNDDTLLSKSTDEVNKSGNMAYHAEVLSVEKFCQLKKSSASSIAFNPVLVTTVEPCAMCYINAWLNDFEAIVFGASMEQVKIATDGKQIEFPITALEMTKRQNELKNKKAISVYGGILDKNCLELFSNYDFPQ